MGRCKETQSTVLTIVKKRGNNNVSGLSKAVN